MTYLLNCENENDSLQNIEVAKNCNVTKDWLFRQKQVNYILYYVLDEEVGKGGLGRV